MKIKHILVSRVAVKWGKRHNEVGLSWDEWIKDSFYLYDKYCRPSLKQQTNQDFILLSLIDVGITEYGDVLNNEKIIKTSGVDIRKTMIDGVNSYINEIKDEYDYVLLTRIDRDDCLKKDFIENLKTHIFSDDIKEKYIDLYYSYTFNVKSGEVHDSPKYHKMVSPFVSTLEKINNGKIRCISFMVDHNAVKNHLNGKKLKNLYAMQVIHENNLKNKIMGDVVNIQLNEFF